MRLRITPGARLHGIATVPGDKSIAHRWLILAATGQGPSHLRDLPSSLDVLSTAACLSQMSRSARPELEAWTHKAAGTAEGNGSTWNRPLRPSLSTTLQVEGEGRAGLVQPEGDLFCGNSGTTMRLLSGVLAGAPFRSVLTGDASLSLRPMERVAEPLRSMGASITTDGGRSPLSIEGGPLGGITYSTPVPSAQIKGAILLAGLVAEGETVVLETANTRDHTERALSALGAPVLIEGSRVSVRRFQHSGFSGTVPGDPSSAAFLVAAAALSGGEIIIEGVGLNPSRLHFLEVMKRMGVITEQRLVGEEVGEPVGDLWVGPGPDISPVTVGPEEIPLVIDEVPVLCMLATQASAESRFQGGGELRNKESDRLSGIARSISDLGGSADVEGDDVVVSGGGLGGGRARAEGDHRMAMALAVASLAARAPCEVEGIESAAVSFPGFARTLRSLGAQVEMIG